MADTKLSALTELNATPQNSDELYIRDISEVAADESKRITRQNLVGGLASSGANTDITGLSGLNTQNAVQVGPFGTSAGETGEIRFLELAAGGSAYVSLSAPDALAGNVNLVLPNSDGDACQVLITNGSGALSWSTVACADALGVDITQSSHGFAAGRALKSSGSDGAYALASADTAANAEVVGIVTSVPDSNTFTMKLSGEVSVAAAVPNQTAGTVLFLDTRLCATYKGTLIPCEPSTAGQISKPLAVVTTANSKMVMFNLRGETVSNPANDWDVNGQELVLDVDGDTSITADSDDQIDIKIANADDFQFTANTFTALSGSSLATNTITETTSGCGVTIDSVLLKDGEIGTSKIQYTDGDDAITIADGGAITVHQAATFSTSVQVDNININGNTISSTAGTDLLITPLACQQIVLDGAIVVDAGVVTGATSISSTEFVGGGSGLTGLPASGKKTGFIMAITL